MVSSDRPISDLNDDLLGFGKYANLLSDIILNSETPLTIGIHGEWGSGKTSLINLTESILREKNQEIKTMKFDAWKYRGESLWRSFILNIVTGIGGEKEEDIRKKLYNSIEKEELGRIQIDWLGAAKQGVKKGILSGIKLIIPYSSTMTGILNGVRKLIGEDITEENINEFSNLISREKYKTRKERMISLEEFEEEFSKLIEESNYEKVVIFIDDLDRCLPSNAVDVLEAFKVFLDVKKCIFVVACDIELVEEGVVEKYPHYGDKKTAYTEKIIQIPFEIPPLRTEKIKEYIDSLDVSEGIKGFSDIICLGIENNPRKIKRFCNDLELKLSLIEVI